MFANDLLLSAAQKPLRGRLFIETGRMQQGWRKTLFFCNSIFAGRQSARISFPVSCILLLMLLFMQPPHCRSMLTAQLQCFNTQPSQTRDFYTQKYIYPTSPLSSCCSFHEGHTFSQSDRSQSPLQAPRAPTLYSCLQLTLLV